MNVLFSRSGGLQSGSESQSGFHPELYNVADALPQEHWERYECFYTNPPFGQSNHCQSIEAFLKRGMEAVGQDALGCLVLADHPSYPWTREVLLATHHILVHNGFIIAELLPEFHHYHLDDAPDLTSCSMVVRRVKYRHASYASIPLEPSMLVNFYGEESPLHIRYVRDLTHGGEVPSRDHIFEPFESGG